jgi:hypothetical protein
VQSREQTASPITNTVTGIGLAEEIGRVQCDV